MSFTSEDAGKHWRVDSGQGRARQEEVTREPDATNEVIGQAGRASVLERAFHVLEQVAQGARPLNLTEVSRAAQLPLPTTYRLAKALVELRALEKASGRYTLGPVWSEWCATTTPERACTST
ncbi:helix-turn-helix domain-containing protein [Saccharothrix saharensis]|uniref:helix-turn-helix domain-containing protein n=1 Tax=Saccharothrix saharensis TaxID=571190 RepID=UPI0036C7D455